MKKSPGRKERREGQPGKPNPMLIYYTGKPDEVVVSKISAQLKITNPKNLTTKALKRQKAKEKTKLAS